MVMDKLGGRERIWGRMFGMYLDYIGGVYGILFGGMFGIYIGLNKISLFTID